MGVGYSNTGCKRSDANPSHGDRRGFYCHAVRDLGRASVVRGLSAALWCGVHRIGKPWLGRDITAADWVVCLLLSLCLIVRIGSVILAWQPAQPIIAEYDTALHFVPP